MAAVLPKPLGIEARPVAPDRIGVLPFLCIFAQLGILTLVLRQFQIEGAAFLRLWVVAVAGFAVHAFLPLRLRLPFFLVLSLAGMALVLGFVNAAWLVAVGLVLIGMCHLPIAFWTRIALILAVAAVLIAQRGQWLPAPWPEAIWPILGSMFMFRLIVYLYDLRHEQGASVAGARRRRTSSCCRTSASRSFRSSTTRRSAATTTTTTLPDLPDRRRVDRARRHPAAPLPAGLLPPDARALPR